jgi:pimeloyl-ACP methyl ester carboxylesterase
MRLPATVLALAACLAASCSNVAPSGGAEPRTTVAGPSGILAVDDGGSGGGVPVLFVHSFAGSGAHWQSQLGHLRTTRRAITIDLRGHGRSAPPIDNNYSVPALASDIAAVANALNLRSFVLVGHSMGGAASVAYAGMHPDRVAGLVLVGAPGKMAPAEAQKIVASLNADYDKAMGEYWESLLAGAQPGVRAMLQADRTRIQREPSMAMISAIFAFDPLPPLAAYAGPKLVIDATRADSPGALFRQAPGLRYQLIDGTSHWVQLDKPQDFNNRLDAFLANVR